MQLKWRQKGIKKKKSININKVLPTSTVMSVHTAAQGSVKTVKDPFILGVQWECWFDHRHYAAHLKSDCLMKDPVVNGVAQTLTVLQTDLLYSS